MTMYRPRAAMQAAYSAAPYPRSGTFTTRAPSLSRNRLRAIRGPVIANHNLSARPAAIEKALRAFTMHASSVSASFRHGITTVSSSSGCMGRVLLWVAGITRNQIGPLGLFLTQRILQTPVSKHQSILRCEEQRHGQSRRCSSNSGTKTPGQIWTAKRRGHSVPSRPSAHAVCISTSPD